MRSRFRRQAASLTPLPNFEDPVALRRENAARAKLSPQNIEKLRDWRLREWPQRARATLPARPPVDAPGGADAMDERRVALMADMAAVIASAKTYSDALDAALLIALERKLRRSFGPPYEVDEDDPLLD